MFVPVLQRVVARAVRSPAFQQQRNGSFYNDVVAAPPVNRLSTGELLLQGLAVTVGILGYPFYAMFVVAGHKREEFAGLEIPEQWARWRENQQKKK